MCLFLGLSMSEISREGLHENDDWSAKNLHRLRSLADKGCRELIGSNLDDYLKNPLEYNIVNNFPYYPKIKSRFNEVIGVIENPIPSGGWNPSFIKGRLKKLKNLGFPIENYGNKNRNDLIKYYIKISKELMSISKKISE